MSSDTTVNLSGVYVRELYTREEVLELMATAFDEGAKFEANGWSDFDDREQGMAKLLEDIEQNHEPS